MRQKIVHIAAVIRVLAGVMMGLATSQAYGEAYNFIAFAGPPGTTSSWLGGIDGSNVAGVSSAGGFIYNISTQSFTSIATPGTPAGISGGYVVGYYPGGPTGQLEGFLYNISTSSYTTLNDPSASPPSVTQPYETLAYGISGNSVVGNYPDAATGLTLGFIYDISTASYTTLADPLATGYTEARGIDGNYVVGQYLSASGAEPVGGPTGVVGFLFDLTTSTYTTINDPLGVNGTSVTGSSGNEAVGFYTDAQNESHGFLYDITTSTFTTVDDPSASSPRGGTLPMSISGGTFVGEYTVSGDNYAPFIAVPTPEPSSMTLAALAALLGGASAWRRRSDKRAVA